MIAGGDVGKWLYNLNDPPELRHLSADETRALVQRARRRAGQRKMVVLDFVAPVLLFVLIPWALLAVYFRNPLSAPRWVYFVMDWSTWGWIAWCLIGAAWVSARVRRQLQRDLLADGIRPARCFTCGYDLTGSSSRVCTECGARLVPAPQGAAPATPTPSPAAAD